MEMAECNQFGMVNTMIGTFVGSYIHNENNGF